MNIKIKPKPVKNIKITLNTEAGIYESRLPALLRIIAAANMAVLLIKIANLLGCYLIDRFNLGVSAPKEIPNSTIFVLLVSAICAAAMGFGEIWFGGLSARKEEQRLRQKLMYKAFSLRLPVRKEIGSMVNLYTDSIERFCEYRQVYLGPTKAALILPFLVLSYITVCVDWVTGLVLILMCPLIPLIIAGFMKLFAARSKRSREQRAKLSAKYLEALQTLTTLRLFGAADAKEKELKIEGEKNRRTIMRILAGNQIVIIIMDSLFSVLFTCMAVFLAGWRVQSGVIWIGEALQIVFLSVLLLEPLQQVAGFFYIGMGGKAAQRALSAYQQQMDSGIADSNQRLDNLENNQAQENQLAGNGNEGESSQYPMVVIKDLHFAYDSSIPVLKDVNLEIPVGHKVVLVGESGGGKTTLLHLLQGRLEADRGSITIAGKSAYSSARSQSNPIALVSQKTWLFTGTIADNLRVAKADASETQMWESLEKAGVADFIRSLPKKLETSIGEDGNCLSGGQAQRLSLARAFLSGRKLLVLDEPTSQLDADTEKQFMQTLMGIGAEYTILLVTHRYQLLGIADVVYSVSEGKVRAVNAEELLDEYVEGK